MRKVLVLNGANMNSLGVRDRAALGSVTLAEIDKEVVEYARRLDIHADTYQSNHEGDLIDRIQKAPAEYIGIVINPGSFGHYSIGIKEAIDGLSIPCIEVHLARFFNKPENQSKIAPVCTGFVSGFGKFSYMVALDAIAKIA